MRAPAKASIALLGGVIVLGLALLISSPAGGGQGGGEREVGRPDMARDRIAFPKSRKRQMARYSKRHYGRKTWELERPKAIVLHYTAGSSWQGARDVFAANQPNNGERPGVCSHYIVEKSGRIHLIVSEKIRCRHAIGLNWTSFGIEFVQESLGSAAATDRAILDRRRQMRAGLRLVAYLRDRYDIKVGNVEGHATANSSPLLKDRKGWRNDHVDWGRPAVREFRKRLRAKFG